MKVASVVCSLEPGSPRACAKNKEGGGEPSTFCSRAGHLPFAVNFAHALARSAAAQALVYVYVYIIHCIAHAVCGTDRAIVFCSSVLLHLEDLWPSASKEKRLNGWST